MQGPRSAAPAPVPQREERGPRLNPAPGGIACGSPALLTLGTQPQLFLLCPLPPHSSGLLQPLGKIPVPGQTYRHKRAQTLASGPCPQVDCSRREGQELAGLSRKQAATSPPTPAADIPNQSGRMSGWAENSLQDLLNTEAEEARSHGAASATAQDLPAIPPVTRGRNQH